MQEEWISATEAVEIIAGQGTIETARRILIGAAMRGDVAVKATVFIRTAWGPDPGGHHKEYVDWSEGLNKFWEAGHATHTEFGVDVLPGARADWEAGRFRTTRDWFCGDAPVFWDELRGHYSDEELIREEWNIRQPLFRNDDVQRLAGSPRGRRNAVTSLDRKSSATRGPDPRDLWWHIFATAIVEASLDPSKVRAIISTKGHLAPWLEQLARQIGAHRVEAQGLNPDQRDEAIRLIRRSWQQSGTRNRGAPID